MTADRRAVYGFALEQFEQLLAAANDSGPASRPLAAFYALSQAGRAIVAARGQVLPIRGHGLQEAVPADKPDIEGVNDAPDTEDILRRRIKRSKPRRGETRADGKDAFGAVSRATGSPDFEGEIELGAMWAAAPLATSLPPQVERDADWLPYLNVEDPPELESEGRRSINPLAGGATLVSLTGHPTVGAEEALASGRYPTVNATAMEFLDLRRTRPGLAPHVWLVAAYGSKQAARLRFETPTFHPTSTDRVLVPTLRPDDREAMRPLMVWWALLFSLSIFARYEPGLWGRALRIDESPIAAPLETLLDQALEHLPGLVYGELIAPPLGDPPPDTLA